MAGRNGTRKPGTARGSRRRSRTAKESHISASAVKLRYAREWGGWGQLSEDGTGQNNPRLSEGSWGGGLPTLHDGAGSRRSPDAERGKGPWEGRARNVSLPPYWEKPAVRLLPTDDVPLGERFRSAQRDPARPGHARSMARQLPRTGRTSQPNLVEFGPQRSPRKPRTTITTTTTPIIQKMLFILGSHPVTN
jgi:hypothetical protein